MAVHHAEQDLIQASGGTATISVPGILSNVARKELLRTFDAFTQCITKVRDGRRCAGWSRRRFARRRA